MGSACPLSPTEVMLGAQLGACTQEVALQVRYLEFGELTSSQEGRSKSVREGDILSSLKVISANAILRNGLGVKSHWPCVLGILSKMC